MKKSEVIDTQVGDVHVKDTQIADVNIGTYGSEDYVLSTGQKIRAELITNNTLRIFDGVMVYCGVRDAVAVDDYHDVTIENGSQGMNRNDIAVRYFKKDATTGYGAAEFKAIKGTPTSGTATDPEITVTDLRSGDIDHSMKLYRVRLEGLNIVAVEPLFNVLMPMSEQQAMLAELNRKLVQTETGKFILPNGLKIFWGKGETPDATDPAGVYSAHVIFPETFSNEDYFFTCTEFIVTGEAQKRDKVFNYFSHSNSGTYVGCTYPGDRKSVV